MPGLDEIIMMKVCCFADFNNGISGAEVSAELNIIIFFSLFEQKMSFGNEFGKEKKKKKKLSPGVAHARYSSKDYTQINLSGFK